MARQSSRAGLDHGVVSVAARRRTVVFLLAAAILWRLLPWLDLRPPSETARTALGARAYLEPFAAAHWDLAAFVSEPAVVWIGSPFMQLVSAIDVTAGAGGTLVLWIQLALSVLLPLLVYRLGSEWLGFLPGFLAAMLTVLSREAVFGGMAPLPESAFAVAIVLYLHALLSVARARAPRRCLGLGAACGGLTWISGLGGLWLPFSLAWLSAQSKAFRRRGLLLASAWFCLGWVALMAPIVLRGAILQHELILPFSAAAHDARRGAENPEMRQAEDRSFAVEPMERFRRARASPAGASGGLGVSRFWSDVGAAARAWTSESGGGAKLVFRRWGGFLGGGAEGPLLRTTEARANVRSWPMLPLGVITALSWLGALALIGSFRTFAPVYLSLGLPLLASVLTGVSARSQLMALPALCLLAGYGLSRVWLARRWPFTWVVAPLVTALGAWVVRAF